MLLLPFKLFAGWLKLTWILFRLAARSLRDILDPRIKPADVVDTRASFAVARRKLRRMKKPLLYEAVVLLSRIDPHYIGLLESGADSPGVPQVWEDLAQVSPTPAEERRIHRVRERAAKRMLYLPKFLESSGLATCTGALMAVVLGAKRNQLGAQHAFLNLIFHGCELECRPYTD